MYLVYQIVSDWGEEEKKGDRLVLYVDMNSYLQDNDRDSKAFTFFISFTYPE